MRPGAKTPGRSRLPHDHHYSQRQTLRIVNQGYGDAGGSTTKRSLKGFNAVSGSPQGDIDDNNQTIRQRARMLYMGSPIATSAIRTNRTNVIGLGLIPKSAIDAAYLGMGKDEEMAWRQAAEREFALWANDKRACDSTGLNNFYGLEQLVFLSWLLSGDCITTVEHKDRTQMLPYSLRLHVYEADRIATPPGGGIINWHQTTRKLDNGNLCYDGVEIDRYGAVVAYHICNTYPQVGGLFGADGEPIKYTRVLAYGKRTGLPNVLHVMDSERPEQYRGVSYLAPVIEPLAQIRRYSEAELVAAVIESFFTAFVKTQTDADSVPFNEVTLDGEAVERDEREYDDEYDMGPGQMNVMKPGDDIVFADPKRPANGFTDFVHTISEEIGAALEIPVDLLLKQFTASYSASRAALLEAWKSFRMRRRWFIDDFCQPVWELLLTEAVALGRINAPGFFSDPTVRAAYLKCQWVGPSQGQLDPTKEIDAEVTAIEQGLTTREAAAIRVNGSDWDANIERLAYENERLAEVSGAGGVTPEDAMTQAVSDLVDDRVGRALEGQTDEGGDDDAQA